MGLTISSEKIGKILIVNRDSYRPLRPSQRFNHMQIFLGGKQHPNLFKRVTQNSCQIGTDKCATSMPYVCEIGAPCNVGKRTMAWQNSRALLD